MCVCVCGCGKDVQEVYGNLPLCFLHMNYRGRTWPSKLAEQKGRLGGKERIGWIEGWWDEEVMKQISGTSWGLIVEHA